MPVDVIVLLCFYPTCLLFEVKKKLLVKNEGHTADLFYFGLCSSVSVDEVGCDGNRQLPPELLPFETWRRKSEIKNETETEGIWILKIKPVLLFYLMNPKEI